MTQNLLHAIREASREKDLEIDFIVHALEEAIATAARKFYHLEDRVVALHDADKDEIRAYVEKRVVQSVENPKEEITVEEAQRDLPAIQLGEFWRRELDLAQLGRIAAQTAKQVLYQKIREAERINVYKEYIQKIGDLVNGTIKRFEKGEVIVDLGKAEARIPREYQSRNEKWNVGERIRAVIADVQEKAPGPQIVLSRRDPRLLIRLLEMEVPEIYDGTVIVKNAVRDPGERAKVAVYSRDRDVDAVGACVGIKGGRIQAITRELRGEKIDIIHWADDIVQYAQNALAPAKINRVLVKANLDGTKQMDVVVDNDSLSLAIGKKGQNVRLAAELIGARIEIKSEADVKREVQDALTKMLLGGGGGEEEEAEEAEEAPGLSDEDPVETIPGVGPKTAEKLKEAGFATVADLRGSSAEALARIPGMGEKRAASLIALVSEGEAPDGEEAEGEEE
jgi:N utilization substance protein A